MKNKQKSRKRLKSLLDTPAASSGPVQLADFVELSALRAADKNFSRQDLVQAICRGEEDDSAEESNAVEESAARAFKELATRGEHLKSNASRYPFQVSDDILQFSSANSLTAEQSLYLFLLTATRLNMRDDRLHAGMDGAELFEALSLEIAKRYWGWNGPGDTRVDGLVFGTARRSSVGKQSAKEIGGFRSAVAELCSQLGEGGGFKHRDAPDKLHPQDDKVDVVVWRGFSDNRPSKLIGFGQCKTGDHWHQELRRLDPMQFCLDWFCDAPVCLPVTLFFLTDRIVENWTQRSRKMVLFDRCRVLDYADDISGSLLKDCERWTKEALQKHGLSW